MVLDMAGNQQDPKTKQSHRGRLQAQGKAQPQVKVRHGKIEKSEPWSQDKPPTESEMLALLDKLQEKLPPAEQKVRERCFEQARAFIRARAAEGGIQAPCSKTWRNPKLRGGVRVDLEVETGWAAVPDTQS